MQGGSKSMYEALRAEQDELSKKMQAVKADAVKYAQELVDAFGIRSAELVFEDQAEKRVIRPRGPAPIKYRTPTGIEWTGKGNMKKEFREYLLSEGLTEEDKDLFLTPEFQK